MDLTFDRLSDAHLIEVMQKFPNLIIYGASDNMHQFSGYIPQYLKQTGRWNVFTVNSKLDRSTDFLGNTPFETLHQLSREEPDVVKNCILYVLVADEDVNALVRRALEVGIPCIWTHEGLESSAGLHAAEQKKCTYVCRDMEFTYKRLLSTTNSKHTQGLTGDQMDEASAIGRVRVHQHK
ncbi:hypothetical protein RCL1_004170 [Eukaryota sp. TZLM3-RCL]